jgi:hypothetical protein|tara:strand:- start:775 stop:912 length:138 start_codon:yes stop_codon:yes gene_type:complete
MIPNFKNRLGRVKRRPPSIMKILGMWEEEVDIFVTKNKTQLKACK